MLMDAIRTFIKAGLLIDGNGNPPVANPVVVVEGSRVTDVYSGPLPSSPDGAVLDLGGMTVMPGLWDAHIHITGTRNYSPAEHIINPHDYLVIRAVEDCRNMLWAGITSVRDCGSLIALSLKRAINEGVIPGPHIWASGLVISQTGGHADAAYLPIEMVRNNSDLSGRLADGPDDCRRATREAIRLGADFVKICTSGGVGSPATHPLNEHFTPPEIAAITSEAHRAGRRVATHAQGAPGIKNAVREGVDSVEHGYFLDDECIDLMLEHGTFLVPTFCLIEVFKASVRRPLDMPPWRLRKQQEVIAAMEASLPKAYKAGVKIATGSDYFGPPMRALKDNADEPVTLVKYGMRAMDAIVAATRTAAECIGAEHDMGTLEKGKTADIVGIKGNPLDDITLLKSGVSFVMKDGNVFRHDK
jgi:imidazolonepropionase-like amidohydrolase